MPMAKRVDKIDEPAAIALDLGATKLASAIFVGQQPPLHKRALPLENRQGAAVGRLIINEVKRLARTAARRGIAIRAIGIAVPGIVSVKTGRVWAPNIPGWDDYPLRDELRAAVDDKKVKIVADDDRAASILGEAWQGAARGSANAIFLAVGTGIGAGILADGRVLRGADGIAGAIGWLALDRPFRPEYVACGCFESSASGAGLAKAAKIVAAKRKGYGGRLRSSAKITAHDVFKAFEQGDPVAKAVLRQAIEYWGMASANLVSLFNPEKIIFGGGLFGPALQFLDAITVEARKWAQPISIERVGFEASQLGADAALFGAAYAALRKVKNSGSM
jgi:glucokinase